jgi:hypothetical protein
MSFRQFGGLQYAARHNAVSSNYNTANNLLVTQNVGQPNSYINFDSDISGNISVYGNFDLSGNLNVSGDINCASNITANEFFITGQINYSPNSVVPKSYVDLQSSGFQPKTACSCATTQSLLISPFNGTYNGSTITGLPNPLVIDGFTVPINARVLVVYEGTLDTSLGGYSGIENGIYSLTATSTLTRTNDMLSGAEVAQVLVSSIYGTVNSSTQWVQANGTSAQPITVGTGNLEFIKYRDINLTLGNGLNLKAANGINTLSVDSSLNFLTQVGINNTSPSYSLDISGNYPFRISYPGNLNTSAPDRLDPSNGGNYGIQLTAPRSGYSTIPGLGIGIDNTTTPSIAMINFAGNASQLPLCLQTRGSYVGIGTTAPAYTLDVNGTLRVTGATFLSSPLTMNASTGANRSITTSYLYCNDVTTNATGLQLYQNGGVTNYDNNVNSGSHNFAVNNSSGTQVIPLNITSTNVNSNFNLTLNSADNVFLSLYGQEPSPSTNKWHMQFGLSMGAGSYNPSTKVGDNIIFFTDNTTSYNTSSGLVIAPWTNQPGSIRVSNTGVSINTPNTTSTSNYAFNVSGATKLQALNYPGCICGFFNDSGVAWNGPWWYIFCSSISLTGTGTNVDDYWYVLPGYKFILYDGDSYSGTILGTFDNYSGTSVSRFQPSTYNSTSSVKVYFQNDSNEIIINGISNTT